MEARSGGRSIGAARALPAALLGALAVAPLPALPRPAFAAPAAAQAAGPAPSAAIPETPTLLPGGWDLPAGAEAGLDAIEQEARRHEAAIAAGRVRRDVLADSLRGLEEGSALERLLASRSRRRARADLERVVADLQRHQARLLELQARRETQVGRSEERDWERLEALVTDAAAAWREGRGEEPALEPAIAAALAHAGDEGGGLTVERYRSLVDRLARVNTIIARMESGDSTAVASPTPVPSAPPAETAAAGISQFLGVAERGAAVAPSREASLAAWTSLRSSLANEIIATASEITRRARRSS